MQKSKGPGEMSSQKPLSAAADQFQIRPDITFFNHGSFGACPRPVFEVYQEWQRRLEADPVEFLGRRLTGLLDEARAPLAEYVGARTEDLVFVENATFGVNIVAHSLLWLDWHQGPRFLFERSCCHCLPAGK